MKKLIIGNWKMNGNKKNLVEMLNEIAKKPIKNCNLGLCLPFLYIDMALKLNSKNELKIGAQNCCFAEEGSLTGEVSANMLKDIGAQMVIIGHSERRKIFAEDSAIVAKKLQNAFKNDLNAVLCVGEDEVEYLRKIGKNVIEIQLEIALAGISTDALKNLVIAYEPVWAIGAKNSANKEQVKEMIGFIKEKLAKMFGKEAAKSVRVIYGGAVTKDNAGELSSVSDGFLVGRASQNVEDFLGIISAVNFKNEFTKN